MPSLGRPRHETKAHSRVRPTPAIRSILLVEDDSTTSDILSRQLRERLGILPICTRYPTHALQLAAERFFDFILLDVTIDFNGSPFGGLELYKALLSRYGRSSLLAYSQFITDDLLARYNYQFNFLEKGADQFSFVDKLCTRVIEHRRQQTCFVAMPFAESHKSLFNVLRESLNRAQYKAVRIDQQSFTTSIIKRIRDEIVAAKLVIFVALDRNPNVFYEAGYAHALGKEVLTITRTFEDLPFDVRDNNAIAYRGSLTTLEDALAKRLRRLVQSVR